MSLQDSCTNELAEAYPLAETQATVKTGTRVQLKGADMFGGRSPERTKEISQGLSGDGVRSDTPGNRFQMCQYPGGVPDSSVIPPGCPLIEILVPGAARTGAGGRCPRPLATLFLKDYQSFSSGTPHDQGSSGPPL